MRKGETLLEALERDAANQELFARHKTKDAISAQLVQISKENLDIVDELVDEIRDLYSQGREKEATHLLAISKKILYNNAKYQIVAEHLLADRES